MGSSQLPNFVLSSTNLLLAFDWRWPAVGSSAAGRPPKKGGIFWRAINPLLFAMAAVAETAKFKIANAAASAPPEPFGGGIGIGIGMDKGATWAPFAPWV